MAIYFKKTTYKTSLGHPFLEERPSDRHYCWPFTAQLPGHDHHFLRRGKVIGL
jgi:hypothetical protein